MARAWSRKVAAGAVLTGALFAPGAAAGAADEPRERARLEQVRRDIEALRERLERTEAREGSVLDALDDLDLRGELLGRELLVLRRDLEEVGAREAAARREAEALQSRLAARQAEMRAWLREAYKAGPLRYARVFAAARSASEVAAARRAMETLALDEARRVEAFRDDAARADAALADLHAQGERLAALEHEVWNKKQEVRDNRRRKEGVLASIKKERAVQKKALLDLEQVERDLRGLLGRLGRKPLRTLGFARRRGHLDWPVAGPITVPFGNVRHPRFSTQIPHPGIEIGAPAGQPVRAVFDGEVVFSDWFRGYGQMVVIDHADGYLSIYGHLDERLVATADRIVQGDRIGRCGSGGAFDTPGLYFEIRRNGAPEDPAAWLRRPAAPAAGRPTARGGGRAPRPAP
jgi:septal ring factor EnvC (AmiA/AmiB activator)